MSVVEQLRKNIVQVDGKLVVGTGFFISEKGHVLTCYHLVKNQCIGDSVTLWFEDKSYESELIFKVEIPDVAILLLKDKKLPDNAVILLLGKWKDDKENSFVTLRFQNQVEDKTKKILVKVEGEILNRENKNGITLLQLSLQQQGEMEIRGGMSGAPIYHQGMQRIVGIIKEYTWLEKETEKKEIEKQECIPYAVAIEEIAKLDSPIKEHLHQQLLLTQLYQVNWSLWFTESLFKSFCEKLPIKILKPYGELGNNISENFSELLDQLQQQLSDINEFISCLTEYCPLIPLRKLIEELSPFDNLIDRKNEKETALRRARFFEAPVGYGKKTLLQAIKQQSHREKWLPLYVEIPQKGMKALELARQVATVVGIAASDFSMETLAAKLSGALEQQLKNRIGIFLLIDNADNLLKEEISNFSTFLENLKNYLAKEYRFELTLAGRSSGLEWQKSFEKMKLPPIEVESLKPFHFEILSQEIIQYFPYPPSSEQIAQLMYETGGHPGCVIQRLKDFTSGSSGSISPCLEEKIKEVNDSIPKSLQNVLVNLCVLRRYDYFLLNKIQTEKIIEYQESCITKFKMLFC
ncbi:MAG: AAA family ATPase [Thioploca sp.]|nr:AAA family ATPase [Thioploca sp.]